MNESEWLSCADPTDLLHFIGETASERKLRLFICGCARQVWRLMKCAPLKDAINVAEMYVDGNLPARQLLRHNEYADTAHPASDAEGYAADIPRYATYSQVTASEAVSAAYAAVDAGAEDAAAKAVEEAEDAEEWEELREQAIEEARPRLEAEQCGYIRCLFGSWFRPVPLTSAWRTDTVVLMARQMYDAHDFSAMPILADALQDAGCDNSDILDHCGGPGPHVRGCWVVDLILGKE